MGTECNSDSVGKTDSYCVSKMVRFVVIPAGMWELNAIVTQLHLHCHLTSNSTGTTVSCNTTHQTTAVRLRFTVGLLSSSGV